MVCYVRDTSIRDIASNVSNAQKGAIPRRLGERAKSKGARYGRNAHMTGPSVETGRPGLAFVLICQRPEGRNERDPKARGDPGYGCRRL